MEELDYLILRLDTVTNWLSHLVEQMNRELRLTEPL